MVEHAKDVIPSLSKGVSKEKMSLKEGKVFFLSNRKVSPERVNLKLRSGSPFTIPQLSSHTLCR